jgi:hypothetical protein
VYDPAKNITTIDITYNDNSTFGPTLQFYAGDAPHSSGHGDAQYYLGIAEPCRNYSSSTASYRFVTPGDFRGKWVSATITHNFYYGFLSVVTPLSEGQMTNSDTSELSNAVQVH